MSRAVLCFCLVIMIHSTKRIQSLLSRSPKPMRFFKSIDMSTKEGHDSSSPVQSLDPQQEAIIRKLQDHQKIVPRLGII